MKRTRRNHRATFKAPVDLAAVKGDKTLTELAEQISAPTLANSRLRVLGDGLTYGRA